MREHPVVDLLLVEQVQKEVIAIRQPGVGHLGTRFRERGHELISAPHANRQAAADSSSLTLRASNRSGLQQGT